ncbi:MAG TPA: ligase-associated DNA damage response endonuclease PdeM [Chitinophagaceae bacterium]|jgi:DNA ligase-associated metallophosphoesterase|nr:ligase-associated DNA damage response endonuclease PdeM [Chitinophagaceae bacterium]
MQQPLKHIIHKNSFWLSADRCMYWEEEKALIVADLHFGKTGHFRKSGIAVPQAVYKEDLQRLVSQLQHFQPKKLIIVGDMFHSEANKELDLFQKWRNDFPTLKIHLVKGNHDILHDEWYQKTDIEIHQQQWIVHDLCFCHDITDIRLPTPDSRQYFFCGHIHPAIHLSGTGKQSLRFPCFYFAKNYAVLPAFSRFTGTHLIDPGKNEVVFAIANEKIIQVA